MVVFKRLTPPEMRTIVDLMMVRIASHLLQQDMKLEISEAAKDKIAEEGFDKVYGARPLRRVIQRVIEDPLSEELLKFKYHSGDTVLVELDADGQVKISPVTAPAAKKERAQREPKEPKEPKEPAATAAAPTTEPEG